MEMARDVDRDWIGVDRDGDVDRNAKWRQEIGMEMERNDRDLKVKKCYICKIRVSEFLIWVNFCFLEYSEPLEYVISIVKIHFPSQNKKDLEKIIKRYRGLIDINFVKGNPIKACHSHSIFINILTSAGHHALKLGKPVCNYAPIKMRDQVKEFGNDPYPYSFTTASEITNKLDLKAWLNISKKNKNFTKDSQNNYLSLKDLCKKLNH